VGLGLIERVQWPLLKIPSVFGGKYGASLLVTCKVPQLWKKPPACMGQALWFDREPYNGPAWGFDYEIIALQLD